MDEDTKLGKAILCCLQSLNQETTLNERILFSCVCADLILNNKDQIKEKFGTFGLEQIESMIGKMTK